MWKVILSDLSDRPQIGRAQNPRTGKQARPPIWPLLGFVGLTVLIAFAIVVGTATGSPAPLLVWFGLLFVGFLTVMCAWAYFHVRRRAA